MALSLTRAQASEKAFNMVSPDGSEESGLTVPDVELMINEAASKLCDDLLATSKWYRLQAAASVAVTAGVGDLPATMLAETVMASKGGRVTFTRSDNGYDNFRGNLHYLQNFEDLNRPRPGGSQLGYYTIRGGNSGAGKLYVSSGDGLDVPVSGDAVVLACHYYTFETMPSELEDDFLSTLADMVRMKMGGGMGGGNGGS